MGHSGSRVRGANLAHADDYERRQRRVIVLRRALDLVIGLSRANRDAQNDSGADLALRAAEAVALDALSGTKADPPFIWEREAERPPPVATCPVCGSDDPALTKQPMQITSPAGTMLLHTSGTIWDCPHPFHSPPSRRKP